MMNPTFLSVARQGRHTWKDYLFGLLTLAGTVFGVGAIIILLAALVSGIPLTQQGEFQSQLYNRPFLFFVLVGLIAVAFLAGLYLAVHRVHKRNFLTLISPDASINRGYLVSGFGIWFGISIVNFLVWYVVNPSRYTVIFNSSEWFPFAGLALIITPIVTLVIGCFLYSYLLQAVGLWVRRPVLLLVIWSVVLTTVFTTPTTPENWIGNIIRAMFLIWIILHDDRLERVLGIIAADVLLGLLFIRLPDVRPTFPAIFSVAELAPFLPTLISYGLKAGVFYYLCFGRRRIQAV